MTVSGFFGVQKNEVSASGYANYRFRVHVNLYSDCLEITSPGGMPDGTLIQIRDVTNILSSLKKKNKIEHIGAKKGGYWKLN